jgi:hypothetical protein
MTLNERILDFLDGSLPAEDEAELLHSLSVSPEKRGMLRNFMLQGSLLARDAKSLTVPYAAEQRLWARMDRVLPVTASEESGTAIVPLPLSNAGFLARTFSGASAIVGALILLTGIGIGYFAGHSQTSAISVPIVATQTPQINSNISDVATSHESYKTNDSHVSYGMTMRNRTTSRTASTQASELQNPGAPLVPSSASNDEAETASISPVAAISEPTTITPADIGGDGVGIKPMLHYIRKPREENGSLLSRFEFRVDESFGRQYPNNIATTVSQPILTNLSLTTFFQVFPHSNLFWAGVSGGSANIARKNLDLQTISPSQNILSSDTVSTQTSYLAVLAELRLPAFDMTNFTFTGGYGYGFAGLGQMLFGEIGLHGDLSNEAGYQCGLRFLRFSYSLNNQESAARASSGTSSLTVPNGIVSVGPSYNAELNVGLFFHF